MTELACILDAKAALGECPVWCGEEKVLYWVDISNRAIHRLDPATGENRTWTFPDVVGSFALRERGGLIVAIGAGLYSVDLETMAMETIAEAISDRAQTRLNDGKCDPAGRFWVGAMDLQKSRRIAALYRVDRDRGHHKMVDNLIISNGLAWSPDGRIMYHSDSRQNTIWAYDFDLASGEPGNRRVFARVDPKEGRPDGAAVDAEGFYWSAGVGGGRLTRYGPDGKVDRVIKLPVTFPSMCAFGGENLDVLYVTSIREMLTEAALMEEPLAGGVFAIDPGVKGLPEPRYGG
ncbi:MAG: SMP-30/gluconolactonase/LRE family protein [Kiloniellaceae bacterium]